MYIPTQKERYSKAANITLLLCVIVPSALVLAFAQGIQFSFMQIISGFTWPLMYPILLATGSLATGYVVSSLIQIIAFLMLRRAKLEPKRKITIAITWGMFFALVTRIILAYDVWRATIRAGVEMQ